MFPLSGIIYYSYDLYRTNMARRTKKVMWKWWNMVAHVLGEGPTPVFGSTWKQNHCRTPLDVFWRGGNNQSLGSGWGFLGDGWWRCFACWFLTLEFQNPGLGKLMLFVGLIWHLRYPSIFGFLALVSKNCNHLGFPHSIIPQFHSHCTNPWGVRGFCHLQRKKTTALRLQFWISFTTRIDLLVHWCQHSSRRPDRMWALSRFFHVLIRSRSRLKLERMGCSLFSWLLDIDPQFVPVEINKGAYQCQQSLKQHYVYIRIILYTCIIYGHFSQDSWDMMYDHGHGVVWITCSDRTWQTKLHDWFLKFEGMSSILWPQLSKNVSSFTPDPLNTWQFHWELNIPWPLKEASEFEMTSTLMVNLYLRIVQPALACVCIGTHVYYIYIFINMVGGLEHFFGTLSVFWE